MVSVPLTAKVLGLVTTTASRPRRSSLSERLPRTTAAVPTIPVITDRLPDVEDAQRYAARAARVNRGMAGF
jgi:hypothetical protein